MELSKGDNHQHGLNNWFIPSNSLPEVYLGATQRIGVLHILIEAGLSTHMVLVVMGLEEDIKVVRQ
ncbi:hypothetical protein BDV59DRAFT_177367 [Aspergillus ambiguus]|uniref:uncharacterized protein n=1 Tax=Aspergillus ambiguus TaxID=176160 RepID=UPI003CCD6C22